VGAAAQARGHVQRIWACQLWRVAPGWRVQLCSEHRATRRRPASGQHGRTRACGGRDARAGWAAHAQTGGVSLPGHRRPRGAAARARRAPPAAPASQGTRTPGRARRRCRATAACAQHQKPSRTARRQRIAAQLLAARAPGLGRLPRPRRGAHLVGFGAAPNRPNSPPPDDPPPTSRTQVCPPAYGTRRSCHGMLNAQAGARGRTPQKGSATWARASGTAAPSAAGALSSSRAARRVSAAWCPSAGTGPPLMLAGGATGLCPGAPGPCSGVLWHSTGILCKACAEPLIENTEPLSESAEPLCQSAKRLYVSAEPQGPCVCWRSPAGLCWTRGLLRTIRRQVLQRTSCQAAHSLPQVLRGPGNTLQKPRTSTACHMQQHSQFCAANAPHALTQQNLACVAVHSRSPGHSSRHALHAAARTTSA
jgi:hypothetical protein